MVSKSVFEQEISPYKQLVAVLVLSLIFMMFTALIPSSQYSSTALIKPWVVMCGMILFFAICNSILSIATKDDNTYWMHSIISFAILLVLGGLLAWGVSGVSIGDAGSVKWIYIVFTFGYLVFLSIVNMMKFLVKLAQKQDKGLRGEN
jgi:hypothetical protein